MPEASQQVQLIIVEDEHLIAQRLQRMATEILGAQLQSVQRAASLQQAIQTAKALPSAIILLDLNLAGEDGFDLIRRAVAEPFQTIVVSANIDRAIEAFELGVADFIAKPFSRERLQSALQRVKSNLAGKPDGKLAVVGSGVVELVALHRIAAIHGDDDYARIETVEGQEYLHNKTLTKLEALLPQNFIRVHRSHIVNLDYATRIVKEKGGQWMRLSNDVLVPIGRSYVAKLEQVFIV